ncbi:hypothetical protein DI09_175p50 [Mitosporidium daphniae]|uniref:STAS domain-containing protein n=1 Tax=Mitosporidium daphniae TaxID=1485682 RepID=A0A098VUD5_9MICR|nr:uncharacterized protein DI09_175p50 [Mitosporidium daphniae]KGG52424.1 hypothetical protein DI09_175p50 [Mitosporidium daphniae]|eukprot:XP_013238860.1 uncharacterized protein DI09_175p50 [Mitosporidium daphniae]
MTIFEIKEPLTPSTAESFKKILNKKLENILKKSSKKTRVLIVDCSFVNCCENIQNVRYGASMEFLFPYPIPYSMVNTRRKGSTFGNQMFIIAILLKFYLETEMKGLSEPPLFFKKENIYSTLELYAYGELEKTKRETKSSVLKLFRILSEKIYENDDNLKAFLKHVVIENIKTSSDRLVSSPAEFILS